MSIEITKAEEKKSLVIANIIQQSADRGVKDIGTFKTAWDSATSIYMPNRVALYDIYEKIIIDDALTGAWDNKRLPKVRNKKLIFKKNENPDETFNDLLTSDAFRKFRTLIMDRKLWGISGAEFIPGAEFRFINIPRKHINTKIRVITYNQYGDEGIPYDKKWNFLILGNNEDLGLLLKVAPLVLYKQGNWGDWAQFIEKYGQPFQIYEYDIYDEATRQQALDLAKNAGGNLAIVLPKQLNFRTDDAKQTNSNGELQNRFSDSLSEAIRLILLGNTETSTGGGGSYAKAKVQADDQNDIVADDLADELNVLNSPEFLTILKSYGYAVDGGRFAYEENADLERLQIEYEIDSFLVTGVKLPLDHDYFYKKYNRPKPSNYNKLVQEQKSAAPSKKDGAELPPSPLRGEGKGVRSNQKSQILNRKSKIALALANFFDPARKD